MHHLEDDSVLGEEYVSYEPELEIRLKAQGIGGEGSVQFRLNIRRSKNFISFEGLNTKKFL